MAIAIAVAVAIAIPIAIPVAIPAAISVAVPVTRAADRGGSSGGRGIPVAVAIPVPVPVPVTMAATMSLAVAIPVALIDVLDHLGRCGLRCGLRGSAGTRPVPLALAVAVLFQLARGSVAVWALAPAGALSSLLLAVIAPMAITAAVAVTERRGHDEAHPAERQEQGGSANQLSEVFRRTGLPGVVAGPSGNRPKIPSLPDEAMVGRI